MPLLETVGMILMDKNFTVATAFMQNEQATTYRWVLQQIKYLYFSSVVSTGNEQNSTAHEPCMIITDRERSLMFVIEETHRSERTGKTNRDDIDEEVASQLVNGSWHKLLNETNEVKYFKNFDILKTKWHKRPDFLHYLFNTWLNPLPHKFVRVWTSQVLHFGVETTNRVESEHLVLKLWLATCRGDLDTVFLNIDSFIEGQIADIKSSLEYSRLKEKFNAKSNSILKNLDNIEAFWRILEIDGYHPCSQEKDMDMDSEMHDLADLLDQMSTGTIFVVREMRHFAKGVLSSVLPEDPGSGSGSCGRGRSPRAPKGRGRGLCSRRSNLSSVVDPSPCSTFPYNDAFLCFVYLFIENWKNVNGDGNFGYRVVLDFVFGNEFF
ncbi:hypothetical protein M9H77_16005 [Catharanthus roseus]|uniref:Uncharacterized protein n=1 Tax=Catharanthus roseus TaxID=4058 RepID=A0ACC0B0Y0_CATRO|nr:hypothetical protein M9H77_16005 [Catharanthus roseus]